MKPDHTALIDDLTIGPCGSADRLIHALHRMTQTRRRIREGLTAAGTLCLVTAAAWLLAAQTGRVSGPVVASVSPRPAPGPATETSSPRPAAPDLSKHLLTESELLDTFGDRPVAMVTWPDGRQQLLAITHPPVPVAHRQRRTGM